MIDTLETVAQIAERLGERDPMPLAQIRRIVSTIGAERAQAFVDYALEVEANGGMLVPDGSRRRTLGGVFFALVREGVSEAERLVIFPPRHERRQKKPPRDQQESRAQASEGHAQRAALPKISKFWLDLAAGKPLGPRWSR
jgi:hypothetical protein